jgi:hypothetical protein
MATDLIYGMSLAFDDGDLVLDGTGGLAPVVIAGVPNALQAMGLRLLTPFGTDPFNVTYGLDVRAIFVEPNDVRAVKQLIKLSLVQTLATDPRVKDVREILFKDDAEYRERHPELSDDELTAMIRREKTRRSWSVEVVVDLTDAPSQTLVANIGV